MKYCIVKRQGGTLGMLYYIKSFIYAHIIKQVKIGILLVALGQATGCAAIKSERVAVGETTQGVSYFLPKRNIKLSFTRTIADKKVEATLTNAKKKLGELETAEKQAKADAAKAKALYQSIPDGSAAKEDAKKAKETAEGKRKVAMNAVSDQKTKVQTAQEAVQAFRRCTLEGGSTTAGAQPCYNDSIKLTLMDPVPDPRYFFVTNMKRTGLRDDEFQIKTTADGLLSSSTGTFTDRTGDIIVEIAKIVGVVAAPPTAAAVPLTETVQPDDGCTPGPFKYEHIFDPGAPNTVEIDKIKSDLAKRCANYRVALTRPNTNCERTNDVCLAPRQNNNNAPSQKAQGKDPLSYAPGLFYRRPLPYIVSVIDCGKKCQTTAERGSPNVNLQSSLFMLPNNGPISYVPFRASPFVKTVYDVKFDKGLLTQWDADRPSEVLAVVRLPLEIIKAPFEALSEVLVLKVDYSSNAKALYEAQQAEIEAARILQDVVESNSTPPPSADGE
ncbi:MAG: hypothetical protein AAFX54_04005 [Pseudomonadota bacterium]